LIPKGGSTSALTEVFITWRDGPGTVRTRGVSPNQVLAGVGATLRMLNMKLHQAAESAESVTGAAPKRTREES
ncbi:MAG TPA: hypothetical protein DCS76_08215, partial [Gemmatimonadetes bacterium]|nr:hypothetical protein [Gemmatimonadota bacterium]